LFNVHNGKRDVRRAAGKATLAVDQGGVESTAEVVNIKDSPKRKAYKLTGSQEDCVIGNDTNLQV